MAKIPARPRRSGSTKAPRANAGWIAFLLSHPMPYTAAFAKRPPLPKGLTLTGLVQTSLKTLATGKWATSTFKENGSSLVLVAFADKADFDRVKAHHKGRSWASPIKGSIEGFQVVLP